MFRKIMLMGMSVNFLLLAFPLNGQTGAATAPSESKLKASDVPPAQAATQYRQGPSLRERQIQNELYYEQNAFRDAIDRQRAMQRSLEDNAYPYSEAGPTYYESPLESGERQ